MLKCRVGQGGVGGQRTTGRPHPPQAGPAPPTPGWAGPTRLGRAHPAGVAPQGRAGRGTPGRAGVPPQARLLRPPRPDRPQLPWPAPQARHLRVRAKYVWTLPRILDRTTSTPKSTRIFPSNFPRLRRALGRLGVNTSAQMSGRSLESRKSLSWFAPRADKACSATSCARGRANRRNRRRLSRLSLT